MVKFFGTDGIRGEFGGRCVNAEVAKKLGVAIVSFINEQNSKQNSKQSGQQANHTNVNVNDDLQNIVVVLGQDTRESGSLLAEAIACGAKQKSVNANVTILNMGVVPTPCVSFACGEIAKIANISNISKLNCVGVMVSASHNKYSDNGFKIFDSSGFKIGDDFVEYIEDFLSSDYDFADDFTDDFTDDFADDSGNNLVINSVSNKGDDVGAYDLVNVDRLIDDYCQNIVLSCGKLTKNAEDNNAQENDAKENNTQSNNAQRNNSKESKLGCVILDAANGAGFGVGSRVFEIMNFGSTIINNNPNGKNINDNCGATDLTNLINFVKTKEEGVDAGFALDGDADRVAIVDSHGEAFNGDNVICAIAIWLKKLNMLKDDAIVVTSVSNGGVEACLAKHNIKVFRCDVGDRSVMNEIRKRGLSFGGEESGHLIFADFNKCGDGVFSAAFLSLLMVKTGLTIKQLMNVEFNSRFQVKGDISHSMATPHLPSNIEAKIKLIEDCVTKFFNDIGNADRVVIRASGTEKKVRFMIECDDENLRNRVCESVKQNIALALKDEELTIEKSLKD